jgi:L-threonylcarbamoyladenylate synthase
VNPTSAEIAAAVAALRDGDCIGLPTETVYGLAADARNPAAVGKVFALKGRPTDHPLIVHIAGIDALPAWASEIPPSALQLAQAFWPGPLTLILRRRPEVPDCVLHAFGGGLAAPSANRFGRISPTRAEHVRDEFGAAVPIVLDGGACTVGIESTIVDLSGARPRILRPGMLSEAAIEAVIGPLDARPAAAAPRVSGSLDKHYAPRTPLRLLARDALEIAADIGVLALDHLPAGAAGITLPAVADRYAHGLYDALRALDRCGYRELQLERPPETADWTAVHDRLRRAAAGAGSDEDVDGAG